jgi:hypothetical protein
MVRSFHLQALPAAKMITSETPLEPLVGECPVKISSLILWILASSVSTFAAAGPGKGKKDAATSNNSCVVTIGKETASCIVHVNLPAMMLATVKKACTGKGKDLQTGKDSQNEWRADGTCPKENLIGTCNSGDESTYHMQTANYKWADAKLTNATQLKAMCEAGGGKWISP